MHVLFPHWRFLASSLNIADEGRGNVKVEEKKENISAHMDTLNSDS